MTDNDGILLLLHLLNGLFSSTTWVSQYQNGKTSLDLNKQEITGFWEWTICKQSAPWFRQINTPTPTTECLPAGCSSRRPTNSVKALKAADDEDIHQC